MQKFCAFGNLLRRIGAFHLTFLLPFQRICLMKSLSPMLLLVALLNFNTARAEVHVWEKVELTFHAQNPLRKSLHQRRGLGGFERPGFRQALLRFLGWRRCFSRARSGHRNPGEWTWQSGSNQKDAGLNNQRGSFTAVAWSEAEKESVPARRGMIEATPNGHALQYADGTPYLLLGDTWYAAATFRFQMVRRRPGAPHRPGGGVQGLCAPAKEPGLQQRGHHRRVSKLGQRLAAVGRLVRQEREHRRCARRGWTKATLPIMCRATSGTPKTCPTKAAARFCSPARFPGYEQVYPGCGPHQPGIFQIPRPED